MAVRYVVVTVAPAPDPYARSRASVPADLLSVLDAQLDLASITVNPGVRVYRNSAWAPGVALLPSGSQLPDGGTSLAERTDRALQKSTAVLTDSAPYAEAKGDLPGPGEIYVASAGDDWSLKVNGKSLERSSAFGWSNSFAADSGGAATLSFQTPVTRWLLLVGQACLWILVIVYLLRVRVREDERTDLLMVEIVQVPEDAPEEFAKEHERPEGPDVLDRILIDTGIIDALDVVAVREPSNIEGATATQPPEMSAATDVDQDVSNRRRGRRRRSK
jgi:hypothetical protein